MNPTFYTASAIVLLIVCLMLPATIEAKSDKERAKLLGPVMKISEESDGTGTAESVFTKSVTYDRMGMQEELLQSFSVVQSDAGPGKRKTIFKSESKDHERHFSTVSENGTVLAKGVYVLDKGHNVLEQRSYNSKGELQFRWVFTHDAQGRLIKSVHYNGAGLAQATLVEEFSSDASGRLISTKVYRSVEGVVGKLNYEVKTTFSNEGDELESVFYHEDKTVERRIIWMYDEHHALKEMTVYRDEVVQEKETYAYEYDAWGNWTKKTTTRTIGDQPTPVKEAPRTMKRTITYFNR